MAEGLVFLDSSILIGLVFRNASERANCESLLPSDSQRIVSRYVIFEVARGYMRRLIRLHNESQKFSHFSKLFDFAQSGKNRYTYDMGTWLGAFSDYFRELEMDTTGQSGKLCLIELRAKIHGWLRRGWKKMNNDFTLINAIGCRANLAPPHLNQGEGTLIHDLPITECGLVKKCGLSAYFRAHMLDLKRMSDCLGKLPKSKSDPETQRRIASLNRLLSLEAGHDFNAADCYSCGDALIYHEAPADAVIATKNRKHFQPFCDALGKRLAKSSGS